MKTEILIVGAGAAGLMATRELARAGKKVAILEARDRVGGRIWPLQRDKFGYSAEAGAEFVHGKAEVSRNLIKEAGLSFVPISGEIWNNRSGVLTKGDEFMPYQKLLNQKLKELETDMPIASFLEKYFGGEEYKDLRNSVRKMVEGYDAADPEKISTFTLREEWLGNSEEWQQGRIKEGYGALLNYLVTECKKFGAEIILKQEVREINWQRGRVLVKTSDQSKYEAEKIIITVPLPILPSIKFNPSVDKKMDAVKKFGFGGVIKLILKFSDNWWDKCDGKDLSALGFLLSNEKVMTWWTQYPENLPVLTGWIAGPDAEKFKNLSSEKIVELAIVSLSNIFAVSKDELNKKLVNFKVVNWPLDPYTRGAYSFSTLDALEAQKELLRPEKYTIFFAGEALYSGKETATVEGALASGKEVAEMILGLN